MFTALRSGPDSDPSSCEMAASAGRVQWLFASFWATDTYVAGARPLFAAEAASLRR